MNYWKKQKEPIQKPQNTTETIRRHQESFKALIKERRGLKISGISPDTLEEPLWKQLPLGKPLGNKNGWLQERFRAQIQETRGPKISGICPDT